MKQTDKRKWRIQYPLFFILLSAFLVYTIIHRTSASDQVKVKTYQVSEGWGYRIIIKDKVFIDQPFIPVLPGKKAFPDKKSAFKAGNIVKQKLISRKLPALTKEDIEELGLDSLGVSN
jgi:hypothetical protein